MSEIDLITVDKVDLETGEVSTVAAQPVQVVKRIPYRTSLDASPSPSGDDEVNNGPYLVDETGYMPLEQLYRRSLQQGVIPFEAYTGDYDIGDDTDIDGFDEPEAPEPTHSEGASSSEVSGSDDIATDSDVNTTD